MSNSVKNKFTDYEYNSKFSLVAIAHKGLTFSVFDDFASLIKMPAKNLAQIIHISPRAISSYKTNKKTLEPTQGEHLLALISLYRLGEELFGNIDKFNQWLQMPFWNSYEKPIEWLVTPGGIDLVKGELTKLAYGDVV